MPLDYQIIQVDQPTESIAERLSRISKASKAHWGYPPEWLELWRADLEVTPAYLAQNRVFLLELLPGKESIGFCIIQDEGTVLSVEHLWILPAYIGRGLGAALLQKAIADCMSNDIRVIRVVADPNAAPFYAAKGFITVSFESSMPEGRRLPVMEKEVE